MNVKGWIPLTGQLRPYDRSKATHDLVAGIVLSALLIPAGMGYATASGLPPINGLYATIVPLVVYALVGPSRILVIGPDSSLTPLIAAMVVALATTPDEAPALAAMLAIMTGVVCVIGAIARFGFLADLLSKPVRFGYLNGIALTVIVSQLPKVLGFSGSAENLIDGVRNLVDGIQDDLVVGWAIAIAAGTIVVILALRRIHPRIPGALIAMVLAIVVVVVFDLTSKNVDVVGALPRGLPSPKWPGVAAADLGKIAVAAAGVAFVAFADTSVLSRTFALRTGQHVDTNRELGSLAMANIGAGLFQGFPISASSTRTPVAQDAGAETQVTGLVGAAIVTFVVVVVPGIFKNLPDAALAAVVIVAVTRIVEIHAITRLWYVRRSEFVLALAAFAAVALIGPIIGTGVAIALSLLDFMRKAWRPYTTELVRVDGLKGYHDAIRHPEGRRVPGLLLYRFDAPLFFANGGYFQQDLMRRVDAAETPPKRVVVTAEPITDIDSTAADELTDVIARLDQQGIEIAFAELKGHVRDRFSSYGLTVRVGDNRFYRTVGQAVHAYVREHGVEWRDWEDGSQDEEQDGDSSGEDPPDDPVTPPA